jgi:hypothetical protein
LDFFVFSQIGDHPKEGLAKSAYKPKHKSLVIPIILVMAKYRNFAIIKIFLPHFWLLGKKKKKRIQKPLHFLISSF